jgi:hypothetical protein
MIHHGPGSRDADICCGGGGGRLLPRSPALGYLNCKSDALRYVDPEKNRQKALSMFLDDKVFKPGMQEFKRA